MMTWARRQTRVRYALRVCLRVQGKRDLPHIWRLIILIDLPPTDPCSCRTAIVVPDGRLMTPRTILSAAHDVYVVAAIHHRIPPLHVDPEASLERFDKVRNTPSTIPSTGLGVSDEVLIDLLPRLLEEHCGLVDLIFTQRTFRQSILSEMHVVIFPFHIHVLILVKSVPWKLGVSHAWILLACTPRRSV